MKPPIKGLKLNLYPDGSITQWFGENPALYNTIGLAGHNGIDIVAPWGSPMYAIEDATVVEVKTDPGGYGMHVRIISDNEYDGCKREWTYGHCSAIHVTQNQKVKAGDLLANMGNTGFVVSGPYTYWGGNNPDNRGTHLHLGLRRIKLSGSGWSYPGSNLRIKVMDYENGYKGSIDSRSILETIVAANTAQDTTPIVNTQEQIRSLYIQVRDAYQKILDILRKK